MLLERARRLLNGRYELLGELASGGMATVHLAQTRNVAGFRRLFAVKLCHPHMRDDPEFVDMFFDEARLAAMIHHPNVVATVDVGEEHGELYLVMDYVDGERLSSLVRAVAKAGERIPTSVALRIVLDVLAGLGAAHDLVDDEGRPMLLVHRDVSPQNVMVGLDGVARLMDFGIARAEARSTVTREGVMKGKLAYMAPEQILAPGGVDRRADLFAMGVILWELLTGKRLFASDSQAETMHRVLHSRLETPSREGSGSVVLDAVVARALERSPDLRFASAEEMARAIQALDVEVATNQQVAEFADRWLGALVRARRERLMEGATSSARLRATRAVVPRAAGDSNESLEVTRSARRGHEQAIDVDVDDVEVDVEPRSQGGPQVNSRWSIGLGILLVVLVTIAALWRASANPSMVSVPAERGPSHRDVVDPAPTVSHASLASPREESGSESPSSPTGHEPAEETDDARPLKRPRTFRASGMRLSPAESMVTTPRPTPAATTEPPATMEPPAMEPTPTTMHGLPLAL